ncbi:hypothetical protein ACJIZ3_013143 [Penstemon smallii]|uniref:Lysine-specific demethylase JMJ25 n=1 Tax=Penstemon smallii TaxID=265156 RepID=A0ABD3UQJ6_9LAMI
MRDKDPPPDHLRCKRTDGRQWRCKRPAMDGLTLCDIHHLQGKHRQNKQKVPESLKLERKLTKKRGKNEGETSRSSRVLKNRRRCVSEALDDALKKMKLKRGDLHLELIRMFLKRQVEKKKEKELKEINTICNDETTEFQLPFGVMAISHSPPSNLPETSNNALDVKLGVDSNGISSMQRHFRSKNIEPLPISTMQVVPFAEIAKKRIIKKCHWCRETKYQCLIKCLTCKKRFFCVGCIKERYFEKQEVKVKCPACRGTCTCKICMKQQHKANNDKEHNRGEGKLDRIQMLHYIIYMLLPVLKQINRDQSIELEREAKITGKEESEIQILQTKLGCQSLMCCRCKTSIVDYHRTCTNCTYNLCLSCCRELSQHGLYESFKLKSCKKRKIYSSGVDLYIKQTRQNSGGVSLSTLLRWEASADGSIPCPPTDIGGCGESTLDLRCIFPFAWTGDLEVRAEEILCSYHVPETADVSSSCSLCNSIDSKDEVKPPRELSRRLGFCDNYLYCPTVKDLHQETLEHFQNHWGKGHPVIVRNMLRSISGLCWDPVIMFCSYMECKSSESCTEIGIKAKNCLDWCEVEIDRKRIFMGSLEKRTHASMQQKILKFKAWLSSHLFQKQFPVHYNEIIKSLPLSEYINPVSGLFNVGVKLPKEFPKPDLGPSVYFSYGGPEELKQADFLSKLCYGAHDTVNILAYATDVSISPEQINKIESLMKKYKARDRHGQSFSNSSDQKGKSPLQSENTGESGLQDVGEKINLPNGIENVPFHSGDPLKGQTISNANGKLHEDSDDSDDEASILCCGSIEKSEDSDEYFHTEDIESSCTSEDKRGSDSCGAQWDIFRRQDVPKLVEYIKRHSNELSSGCSYSKLVDPILDENYFLDAYHKLRLKEEFDIQPWTFEQFPGEAIFIPAGCPYQIRKLKSCVNVVLDFISPENATQCIQLRDEIRSLPLRHKAKTKLLEVEKMTLHGISAAIEDICRLKHVEQD